MFLGGVVRTLSPLGHDSSNLCGSVGAGAVVANAAPARYLRIGLRIGSSFVVAEPPSNEHEARA
jgi:hypothetical protein